MIWVVVMLFLLVCFLLGVALVIGSIQEGIQGWKNRRSTAEQEHPLTALPMSAAADEAPATAAVPRTPQPARTPQETAIAATLAQLRRSQRTASARHSFAARV